jgi:hypothetical protein
MAIVPLAELKGLGSLGAVARLLTLELEDRRR